MGKEKPATKICKHCKTEIPAGAKVCPQCRKKQGGALKWVIIAFVVICIIGAAAGGNDKSKEASNIESDPSSYGETGTEKQDNVPTEYKSALKKAISYSDNMHMSKEAIYDQLTSEYGEKFTEEAANYAMENIEADWNANALAKAQNYSDTMYMSKEGIYDQLISEYGERFTEEEARYAVDNLDADYQQNALKKAQSYQESMNMSPAAIYDQLISEYGEKFTEEEAQYAIDNLE